MLSCLIKENTLHSHFPFLSCDRCFMYALIHWLQALNFSFQLRINALTCIDHMLDSLDKMLILDEILPFLADVSCQDAEVVMTIVGMLTYDLSFWEDDIYGNIKLDC